MAVATIPNDCPVAGISSAPRRRVLLVSYHFPPVGGAGVQRPVKFVKYLRRFGWDVSVLMAANPSVPAFDHSLCRDVPDDTVIERARTWEPGYALKKTLGNTTPAGQRTGQSAKSKFLRIARRSAAVFMQPDAQVLWLPCALKAGKRLLRTRRHDAILATAPPYSNLLLGALLKNAGGLPLITDFRDEWDMSSRYLENRHTDGLSHWIQERLQRRVLRQSDTIIATTRASTERLRQRARAAGSQANAVCIYNGFDPDDFAGLTEFGEDVPAPTERFRIVYTGTLWNLTNIGPLVESIERIASVQPSVLNRLELVLIGRKTPEQQALVDRLAQIGCRTILEDYCEHRRALAWMAGSDALCLLLSDVDGADRVAPAKLFEYLAVGRPVLAIVPDGETADIVSRFYPESRFHPGDVAAIAGWLQARAMETKGTRTAPVQCDGIDDYSRENEAGQLASVLDALVER